LGAALALSIAPPPEINDGAVSLAGGGAGATEQPERAVLVRRKRLMLALHSERSFLRRRSSPPEQPGSQHCERGYPFISLFFGMVWEIPLKKASKNNAKKGKDSHPP
jgi:hypothetical protein